MIWRWLVGLLIIWQVQSLSAETIDITRADAIPLNHAIELCTDPSGHQTIETVSDGQCPLRTALPGDLRPGFTAATQWLRLTLANPSNRPQERFLVVGHPRLETVSLFEPEGTGWRVTHTGIAIPARERPVRDVNPVLPLRLAAGENRSVWIRIASRTAIYLTPVLWNPLTYLTARFDWAVTQTLPLGGLILVTLFSVFMYFSSHDRIYLYFAGFVFGQLAIGGIYSGLLMHYFWPDTLSYNLHLSLLTVVLILIFFALFFREFIGVERLAHTRYLYRIFLAVVIATVCCYLLGSVDYQTAGRWGNVGLNLLVITVISLLLHLGYQGYRLPASTIVSLLIILFFQLMNSLATWGILILPWAQNINTSWIYIFSSPLLFISMEQRSRQMRQQLRHAEDDIKAKQWLVSQVSHELRSPLNTLLGYAQLLDRGSSRVTLKEGLSAIQHHGRYLLGLIDEILDHLRGQTGQLRLRLVPVDLALFVKSLEESTCLLTEIQGNRFRTTYPATFPPPLLLDERRLRQILDNLLNNANHYTRQGDIRLDFGWTRLSPCLIHLVFSVSDTGPGISLAEQASIFEPFRRGVTGLDSGTDGIGMGLTIARQLARLMDGDITVSSNPGQGSTFSFECHGTLSPLKHGFDSGRVIGYLGQRRTLMVVDDNPEHAALLAGLLGDAGFNVMTARGCNPALQAMHDDVDLVITDQFMPEASGWILLARLKAGYPSLPVVLLSAALPQPPASFTVDCFFDDCLIKPVLMDDLCKCLGTILNLTWQYAPVSGTDADSRIDLPLPLIQPLIEMIDAGSISDILAWCDARMIELPELQQSLATVKHLALALDFAGLRQRLHPG